MRMRSLILDVISCYGVYKCVCFCTMISWCSVKASAAIQNSPRSPRNVTSLSCNSCTKIYIGMGYAASCSTICHPYIPLHLLVITYR